MTLPPLIGERGAAAVSAAMTDTSSAAMPRPSAAIVANPVIVPEMSTTPVTTVTRPSASSRQTAAAGCRLPGQAPTAMPTPSPSGSDAAVAPERMRGDPIEALGEAEPAPRRPVGHLVVGRDEVAAAELDGVDVEPAGELVDELLEREGRLRRARCPVGARADPVGLDPVGDHLVGVPAIWPDGEDGRDALDAVLGIAAGLEPQARLEAAQPAIPRRPEPDVEDRAGRRVRHPEVLVAGELEAHRPTEDERGSRDEWFDQRAPCRRTRRRAWRRSPARRTSGDRTPGPAPSACRTSPAWPR